MGRKHNKPEEIVAKLRQVEVLTGHGRSIAEAARSIEVYLGLFINSVSTTCQNDIPL